MIQQAKSILEFLVFTVVVKYLIVHAVADLIMKLFKRFFKSTERESAIRLHYINRALNKGHKHKSPVICKEGKCQLI